MSRFCHKCVCFHSLERFRLLDHICNERLQLQTRAAKNRQERIKLLRKRRSGDREVDEDEKGKGVETELPELSGGGVCKEPVEIPFHGGQGLPGSSMLTQKQERVESRPVELAHPDGAVSCELSMFQAVQPAGQHSFPSYPPSAGLSAGPVCLPNVDWRYWEANTRPQVSALTDGLCDDLTTDVQLELEMRGFNSAAAEAAKMEVRAPMPEAAAGDRIARSGGGGGRGHAPGWPAVNAAQSFAITAQRYRNSLNTQPGPQSSRGGQGLLFHDVRNTLGGWIRSVEGGAVQAESFHLMTRSLKVDP